MLVLARKAGEAIRLGDEIRIVVARVSGSIVRLGIEAPAGMVIVREELLQPSTSTDEAPAAEQSA
jgi:carbon storage regulator